MTTLLRFFLDRVYSAHEDILIYQWLQYFGHGQCVQLHMCLNDVGHQVVYQARPSLTLAR